MKRGSFILGGVASEDINTMIQSRPLIEAPLRRVEHREAYGTDGEVPIDEGAYSTTVMELILVINGPDLVSDRQKVYDLFDSRGVYKDFRPYFDPDKIYRVMLNDAMKFENQHYFGNVSSASANLKVKPYKYLVNSPSVEFTGSKTLNNPSFYASQPIFVLTGTGPVTITVNGEPFYIRELKGSITIDSERYAAYQESTSGIVTPMNDLVSSKDYPIFKPGNNVITVTGAVTKVVVKPRWRSLV